MPIFQLVIYGASTADNETIQFIAPGINSALTFANNYAADNPAELWQGGAKVCTLEYSPEGTRWIMPESDDGKRFN